MAIPRELHCYAYVSRPYARVREILTRDPVRFLRCATSAAATRAQELVAHMKLEMGLFAIDRDVTLDVTLMDETRPPPAAPVLPAMALAITWRAAKSAPLFPSMRAELTVYPLSAHETQLDLRGWYTPPGGMLGGAVDAIVGHRIAEASVHRFLEDVVDRLRIDAV
jgi:hypothetical protein